VVQILRHAGCGMAKLAGAALDYYPEGELIWLEVDTTIRQQTNGQKSLKRFLPPLSWWREGPPKVVPYTLTMWCVR